MASFKAALTRTLSSRSHFSVSSIARTNILAGRRISQWSIYSGHHSISSAHTRRSHRRKLSQISQWSMKSSGGQIANGTRSTNRYSTLSTESAPVVERRMSQASHQRDHYHMPRERVQRKLSLTSQGSVLPNYHAMRSHSTSYDHPLSPILSIPVERISFGRSRGHVDFKTPSISARNKASLKSPGSTSNHSFTLDLHSTGPEKEEINKASLKSQQSISNQLDLPSTISENEEIFPVRRQLSQMPHGSIANSSSKQPLSIDDGDSERNNTVECPIQTSSKQSFLMNHNSIRIPEVEMIEEENPNVRMAVCI